MNTVLAWLQLLGAIIFFVWMAANFFAIVIVGPYFHKKFKHYDNPLFETSLIYPGFIARGIGYCVLTIIKKVGKHSPFKPLYGDLNFREHARTIDVVISYWLVGSFLVGTIVVIMDVVLKFFM